MSVRESFVEHFGEDAAVRIEEASIGHINDDTVNHGNDNWGSEPFRYHLLNCVSHECLGRWSGYHGISLDEEEVRQWALRYAALHKHDGDIPDYIGMLAGAYAPWIDWSQTERGERPEYWRDFEKDHAEWQNMTPQQAVEKMRELTDQAMGLLNDHGFFGEKGPSGERE